MKGLSNLDVLKSLRLSNEPMVGGFRLADSFKMNSCQIASVNDALIADAYFSLCFIHLVNNGSHSYRSRVKSWTQCTLCQNCDDFESFIYWQTLLVIPSGFFSQRLAFKMDVHSFGSRRIAPASFIVKTGMRVGFVGLSHRQN